MIRIILVDDHKLVRDGIRAQLSGDDNYQIVGEASDGQEAIQQTLLSQPDVVVMDINMPNLDGVQATRRLTETNPELGVIIITMNRQDEYIFEAIKAGARAYLLKNANSDELLYAIRTVAAGEALLNPGIAMKMIAEFRRLQTNFGETDSLTLLTDSELEILRLVAQGMSNKDISEKLGLAEKTVRNRLSAIFDKLHVSNRVQATLVALREGLASLDVDNG